jgi:hypothetical protein
MDLINEQSKKYYKKNGRLMDGDIEESQVKYYVDL